MRQGSKPLKNNWKNASSHSLPPSCTWGLTGCEQLAALKAKSLEVEPTQELSLRLRRFEPDFESCMCIPVCMGVLSAKLPGTHDTQCTQ